MFARCGYFMFCFCIFMSLVLFFRHGKAKLDTECSEVVIFIAQKREFFILCICTFVLSLCVFSFFLCI